MTEWKNRITGYGTEAPDQLLANPHNHRIHPWRQQDALSGSLDTLGYIQTVIVNSVTGHIVDGHLRVSMALREGQAEIPVTYVELTEAEEAQALLSLDPIAAMAASDADKVDELLRMIQTDDERVMQHLADLAKENGLDYGQPEQGDAEPQIDRAAELLKKWQVKTGDLWQIGEHRLICGDCTDAAVVARVMDNQRAHLVLTSPPYPGADMWDDLGKVQEIEDIGLNALRRSYDVVNDGCPILWNIANTPIGTQAGVVHTTTTTTTKVAADELGLLCYGEIIWSKPPQHLTPLSFMMRPVVPNLVHEYIMVFYKGKRKQRENTSGLSDELKAIRTNSVWIISPESAKEQMHKAPFPLELAARSVGLYSLDGDVVYEPFAGSGTTLAACQNLSRRCRAVEISPAYVAVALERMATAFPALSIRRLGDSSR